MRRCQHVGYTESLFPEVIDYPSGHCRSNSSPLKGWVDCIIADMPHLVFPIYPKRSVSYDCIIFYCNNHT